MVGVALYIVEEGVAVDMGAWDFSEVVFPAGLGLF